jgi:hypothetical protein
MSQEPISGGDAPQDSQQKMEALMSELHELFGNQEPTPQQQQLMRNLEQHIHAVGEPDVDRPNLVESLEVVVEDLEVDHPRTSAVLRELVATLRNIGV